jgi:hypothetical protein
MARLLPGATIAYEVRVEAFTVGTGLTAGG